MFQQRKLYSLSFVLIALVLPCLTGFMLGTLNSGQILEHLIFSFAIFFFGAIATVPIVAALASISRRKPPQDAVTLYSFAQLLAYFFMFVGVPFFFIHAMWLAISISPSDDFISGVPLAFGSAFWGDWLTSRLFKINRPTLHSSGTPKGAP